MKYWLMKSEPDVFSIDDLATSPEQTTYWEGVRNFQARNFMKEEMSVGDGVLFYYSSCAEPGVVGIAEVASEPYPDHTQFDAKSEYYDASANPDKPKWYMVDIKPVQKLPKYVSLKQMREAPELEGMVTLRRGNRLSITPVTPDEWKAIRKMGGLK